MSDIEARRFSELLPMLEGGDFSAAVDAEFAALLQSLKDHALAYGGGVAAGEMSLKLKIEIDRGDVVIKAEVNGKQPKAPRRRTRLYLGRDGLALTDPRLQDLPFGKIQEVRLTGERRD